MNSIFKGKAKKNISSDYGLNNVFPRVSDQGQMILFKLSLVVTDFLMIGFAFRVAYWIRFEANIPFFVEDALSSPDYYESVILLIIPIWLILFAFFGLYKFDNLVGGVREYSQLFNATTIAVLVVVAAGFFQPNFYLARGWILISWLSAFFFTALGRFLLRRLVYFMRTRGWFLENALIVGLNDEAISIAEQLQFTRNSGLRLFGYISNDELTKRDDNIHFLCLGSLNELEVIIEEHNIQKVILISSALQHEQILSLYQKYGTSDRVKLHISSGIYEIFTTGMRVREFAWVPLVEVNKVRLTGINQYLKLMMDYGLTVPGLILISPILLIIALAVKFTSPGPIIHRRRVMGVNGKEFDAYKFRTMYVDGDEILAGYPEKVTELARTHKLKDDPRITKIGVFIRKTSLDELPQLFNVLRNEMSLIGPRIIAPEEVQEYQKWGMNLLTVKPGITGKWQVSGRSDITYQQRVQLDMFYIRNWSIWLDLQILLQTIPAVLSKKGAY